MTEAQRKFWGAVRDLAQSARRARKVDLEVATDALALEKEVEAKLAGDADQIDFRKASGFARRDPTAPRDLNGGS